MSGSTEIFTAQWTDLQAAEQEELCEIVARGGASYIRLTAFRRRCLDRLAELGLIELDEVWRKRVTGPKTQQTWDACVTPKGYDLVASEQHRLGLTDPLQLKRSVSQKQKDQAAANAARKVKKTGDRHEG